MKFYPADWQADPAVRSCSLAARGLWVEMLCLMQKSEPIGHLLVNGKQPSASQLATLCGASNAQVARGLSELEAAGVFSRSDAGVVYSRRMVRDELKVAEAQVNGAKGGNPSLKAGDKQGVNPQVKAGVGEGVKAQIPEARKSSEPNGSGAEAPSIDPDKRAWSDAVALLMSAGRMTDGKARAFFGKLLKDHGGLVAKDLLPALAQAIANGTQDPQAYLTKAAAGLADRRGGGAPVRTLTDSDESDLWPHRLKGWRESRTWVESLWGPMPGRDGCRVPASMLERAS